MNMQLDVIFVVILSVYEYSQSEIVTSYLCAGILYASATQRYREEGYGRMFQFSFMSDPFPVRVSKCSWK